MLRNLILGAFVGVLDTKECFRVARFRDPVKEVDLEIRSKSGSVFS